MPTAEREVPTVLWTSDRSSSRPTSRRNPLMARVAMSTGNAADRATATPGTTVDAGRVDLHEGLGHEDAPRWPCAAASGIRLPRTAATGISTAPAAAAAVGMTPSSSIPAVAMTSSQTGATRPARSTR